jgi:hypothetical protein
MYCAQYNWRIVPQREFLDAYAPAIRYARLIEDKVPSNGVVYTAQPVMTSYTDREILLNWAAALNHRIADVLAVAIVPAMQPSTRVSFRFAPLEIRRLRILATGDAPMWTIHELDGPWSRTTADPNPWDSGLAADGRLATSWRSWQPVRRGMFFECQPDRAGETGVVSFRTRAWDPLPSMRLDARLESGEWRTLTSQFQIETGLPVPDLRGEAVAELRRHGITHLFIHDERPLGPDFREHIGQWQVRLAGEPAPLRLYAILPAKTIDTARDLRNNTR